VTAGSTRGCSASRVGRIVAVAAAMGDGRGKGKLTGVSGGNMGVSVSKRMAVGP
jgi:hypothetical protein